MAKQKQKVKKELPKAPVPEPKRKPDKLPYIIIFLLAFVLYGNTISHDYALDDAIVITQNQFTKEGIDGISDIFSYDTFTGFFGVEKNLVAGGRYRPFSLVTFAIEYELFGESPHISHIINILLYAITAMLIYYILTILLKKYSGNRKWFLSLPFIITLFYMAHPIHTEVVANIKGRDEILTFLGALLSMYLSLRYLEKGKILNLLLSFGCFLAALLSKENAITFVLIIPLTILFFTKHSIKKNLVTIIPLLAASVIFLVIRQEVLDGPRMDTAPELMNNPFIHSTGTEEIATVLYTWAIYIKLLIFPHPLTFDYYPKFIKIVDFSSITSLISAILHIAAFLFITIKAIGVFLKRLVNEEVKETGLHLVIYGSLIYFISFSIVSNLFFNIGAFMNERFMYISSLGFCIILAYLVYSALGKIFKTQKTANISFAVIAAIIFILYAGKSISRNTVWVNDYTLFTHDVHTSFESAKSTCSAGGKITEEAVKLREIRSKNNTVKSILEKIDKETLLPEREKAAFRDISDVEQLKAAMALREDTMLEQAIVYLKKAVEIHNRYVDAWILLGNAHFHYNKDFEAAAACYYRIIQINPSYDKAFTNLEIIFNQCDSIDLKITTWEKVYALNPNRFEVNYQLGNLFGRYKNDVNKAIPYLENAVRINPKSSIAYKDLGVAYGFSQRYEDAIKTLLKASELDPKDAQIPVNIGVTYQLIGKPEEAMVYFQKAKTIDPNYQIPQMQ